MKSYQHLLPSILGLILGTSPAAGQTPLQIAQQAYLKASNTQGEKPTSSGDEFGFSVAVWGNTVVVGAPFEDSNATGVNGNQTNNNAMRSGAAYIFVREGTAWSQQAYLKASNTGSDDNFGSSVAIWEDTVVVGAPGEASNATGVNGNQSNNSASLSGAAYVFVRTGTNWTQQAYVKASNTGGGDGFGAAVALANNTLLVGAFQEKSSATGVDGNQNDNSVLGAGAAYVFVRNGADWSQQAYLKASDTAGVDTFGDEFGFSVAVDGDTAVVGAWREDSSATGVDGNPADNSAPVAGAAYVFVRTGSDWEPQAYLKASNTGAGDRFGVSVDVSGDTVVVGAYQEDSNATGANGNQNSNSAPDSGAAYVFVRSGTIWAQQAFLKPSNTGADDQFGRSVLISGDAVVVGAPQEDSSATGVNGNQTNNGAENSGASYVFLRTGTTWSQGAYLKPSNSSFSWNFGGSAGLAGNTLVVGASGEFSNATGVDGNQNNANAIDSGAAYLFDLVVPLAPLRPISAVARGPAGFELRIPSAPGQTIGIQYSEALAPASWLDLGNVTVEDDGIGFFLDADPVRLAKPRGFYRGIQR